MKYLVRKVTLLEVPATAAHNAGSKYLQFEFQQAGKRHAKLERYTDFNQFDVEDYGKYISVAQPTGQTDQFGNPVMESRLLDSNKPLPEDLKYFENMFAVVVPTPGGVQYVRVSDDHKTPVRNSHGGVQICTAIRVMCMAEIDNETGQRGWAQGEVPEQKAMRILSQYYEPAWKFPDVVQAPAPGTSAQVPPMTPPPAQTQQQQMPPQGMPQNAQPQGTAQQGTTQQGAQQQGYQQQMPPAGAQPQGQGAGVMPPSF